MQPSFVQFRPMTPDHNHVAPVRAIGWICGPKHKKSPQRAGRNHICKWSSAKNSKTGRTNHQGTKTAETALAAADLEVIEATQCSPAPPPAETDGTAKNNQKHNNHHSTSANVAVGVSGAHGKPQQVEQTFDP
eukprot:1980368-Amphidinium_carterae.1